MPFVDLPEDDVSYFYRSNLPGDGSAENLDRSKQTVIFTLGAMYDSESFVNQLNDPRISSSYNLFAFDGRAQGQTCGEPQPARDAWTDAVEMVKILDKLGLEKVHMFGGTWYTYQSALRMAILFPGRILSVTAGPIERDRDETMVQLEEICKELLTLLSTSKDIQTMEDYLLEVFPFLFGEDLEEDQKDDFALYIETQYPPVKLCRAMEFGQAIFGNRITLTNKEAALVKLPVLLFAVDNLVDTVEMAEALQKRLTGVPGGAHINLLPDGAPSEAWYIRRYAGAVTTAFLSFIEKVGEKPQLVTPTDIGAAFKIMTELSGNPAMAQRDPKKSMSFSCVTQDVLDQRREMYVIATQAQERGFNPVGPNGERPRRFSERYHEQNRQRINSISSPVVIQVSVVHKDEEETAKSELPVKEQQDHDLSLIGSRLKDLLLMG